MCHTLPPHEKACPHVIWSIIIHVDIHVFIQGMEQGKPITHRYKRWDKQIHSGLHYAISHNRGKQV